jgi:RNA polymerase sigma-70 factor, ECF subfamily
MNDLSQAAELAAAHAARLALYARQWLGFADAEEVVQEALIRLLSQRAVPDDLLAWMYAAVRNGAMDRLRSNTRRRRREQAAASERHEWFEPKLDGGLNANDAQIALLSMPRELREIVVLRIWAELGYAQIAKVTGVSIGTAHQRFAEAMKQLRAALEAKRRM